MVFIVLIKIKKAMRNSGAEVSNKSGATNEGESEESEKEERYYDSGLPPPSPFNRRVCLAGEDRDAFQHQRLLRSVSVDQLYGMKDSDDGRGFSPSIECLRAQGSLPPSTSTSGCDVFAERKKKLTSKVMTFSMPDLRKVRAMYNQGIGKSMRSRSSQNLDEQTPCANFDSTYDSLLTDIQGDTGN